MRRHTVLHVFGASLGWATLLSLSSVAHALELEALGGANSMTTTLSSALTSAPELEAQSAGWGYTFGALVKQGFGPIEAEAGLLLDHHQFTDQVTNTMMFNPDSDTWSFYDLQIPLVARYELLPFFSAGGGIFYAHSIGKVQVQYSDNAGGYGQKTYDQAQMNTSDFGLVFNARVAVPVPFGISVIGDFRYLLGLADLNSSGDPNNAFYLREMQFLAGITFGL